MRTETGQVIRLGDYRPSDYLIDKTDLVFRLDPTRTRVTAKLQMRRRAGIAPGTPLTLDGDGLTFVGARIDGADAGDNAVSATADALVVNAPPASETFTLEIETVVDPTANTQLMGLYRTGGNYCTQCEAEGFRRITYFLDRPDVLSVYAVRIEADRKDVPLLLSNGNPVENGDLGDGRHYAVWHDPHPKPSYLFALFAGNLGVVEDEFTTASGRLVTLKIYVEHGKEPRAAYAMDALKRSMRWDEERFGLEYDLDIFQIVAVADFNMGAMENKGLNIFNSSCVLASPETSTDGNFERIEAIIAHEYFHNWTGNRITCRDWFQLCLKEGLTVFRDQQFTADVRSAPVARIENVAQLRARQFPEDQGPLSHPVRPESFQEINNFYTATVYEKGAEVIGMLKTLVGDEDYAKALDLYFDRHDGDAATIEDWLKVFEDATGRDLTQFKRWYSQAGTPRVEVTEDWADGTYALTFKQHTPPTPGQEVKEPQVIPMAVGLLNPNGDEVVPTRVLEITEAEQTFTFDGLASRPVPSINRGFSAPVVLDRESSREERAFLLAHDTDPFNRWEASRLLARESLIAMICEDAGPDEAWLDGLERLLRDRDLDPAYRAMMMGTPTESELAQVLFERGQTPDPDAIHAAKEVLAQVKAERWADLLPGLAAEGTVDAPFAPDAEQSGKRALGAAVLALTSRLDGGKAARAQFASADNMTLQLSALAQIIRVGEDAEALAAFEDQWRHDRLVMDKWFGLQVGATAPENVVPRAEALTRHADFDWKNPNRFRAVMGALAMNHAGFHRKDGSGYRLLTDWLIKLDDLNPQTTARMTSAFQTWKRYDAERQALMRAELERLQAKPKLSRDTGEMVARILGA